jgi:hypothetical protein
MSQENYVGKEPVMCQPSRMAGLRCNCSSNLHLGLHRFVTLKHCAIQFSLVRTLADGADCSSNRQCDYQHQPVDGTCIIPVVGCQPRRRGYLLQMSRL